MSSDVKRAIVMALGVLGGGAVGYALRARHTFRPRPGHVYRIGQKLYADDTLITRLRYDFPQASWHDLELGSVRVLLPGCGGLFFQRLTTALPLPHQQGAVYELASMRRDPDEDGPFPVMSKALLDMLLGWERAGMVTFVGGWSTWPGPNSKPDYFKDTRK